MHVTQITKYLFVIMLEAALTKTFWTQIVVRSAIGASRSASSYGTPKLAVVPDQPR